MFSKRLFLLPAVAATLLLSCLANANELRELTWQELVPEQQLFEDLNAPQVDHSVVPDPYSNDSYGADVNEELNGIQAKLPGFVVPLEIVDEGKISEFLLVPYFGACIHTPPPPPNQIVFVSMAKPIELESMWEPVWVEGTFSVEFKQSMYGSAGYSLNADSVKLYEY